MIEVRCWVCANCGQIVSTSHDFHTCPTMPTSSALERWASSDLQDAGEPLDFDVDLTHGTVKITGRLT
jgi:hypothetical protein